MARTVKLRKYPKKPKQTAAISVLERYLERCKEIDKINNAIKADAKKREALQKRVAAIRK